MASYEIDSVKVEKDNAMRRYNQQRKVRWVVQLCAAFVVLLRSISWLPVAMEISGEFSRRFLSVFDCTFYVFMLVVAIVFVLYASSGQNEAKPDIYEEFVQKTESGRRFGAGEKQPAQFHDKHIVYLENAASPPVHDNSLTVSTITKRTVSQVQSDTVRAVSETSLPGKHYRRTKSERYELRIGERSRRELRRLGTEIRREMVRPGDEPARRSFSETVDNLNNEDFNRTIEAFIAEKKKIQKEESRKHDSESRLALTLGL